MAVDIEAGDGLRLFGALAKAVDAAGVDATVDALDELAEQGDDEADGGDDDAETSGEANSRADGRRVLSPDRPDGGAWSTPSLLDD